MRRVGDNGSILAKYRCKNAMEDVRRNNLNSNLARRNHVCLSMTCLGLLSALQVGAVKERERHKGKKHSDRKQNGSVFN
jgi:hypothetical protein